MSRKLVHVTQDDIDNGKIGDPFSCPIARAVNREFGCTHASVASLCETEDEAGRITWWDLPKKAATFIDEFDGRATVKPFNFYLLPWKSKYTNEIV